MKKLLWVSLTLLLTLAVAAVVAIRYAGQAGSGSIETWIASQLQDIGNAYLNPKVSFTDLDYQYPGTVSLRQLRLTAEDPSSPGTTIDILGCASATLTLAEIPSIGKPIVIEQIVLERPLFSAVAVAPHSNEFVGFSNLVRGGSLTEAPATQPADTPKLSDVFQMRLVKLIDGKIIYDPRLAGTEPMELDQINTTLNIEPTAAGWYALKTLIKRDPVFSLSLDGQLDLDTFNTKALTVQLLASLGEEKLNYLPPQLQRLLRQYQARGDLEIQVSGAGPLLEIMKGSAKLTARLHNANLTIEQYRIPVDSLDLLAEVGDGRVTLSNLKLTALQGTATASGAATLNEQLDMQLQLAIAGMRLQELLATRVEGQSPNLAGHVNASVELAAPLRVILAKVTPATQPSEPVASLAAAPLPARWGAGSIELTEGRLVNVPLIEKLSSAIRAASRLVNPNRGSGPQKPNERVNVDFVFAGDQVELSRVQYVGEVVAARGRGVVALNQNLDMTFHGGPVEKVQAMLGEHIGGALGAVTDQLVAYRVTGTVESPNVAVQVASGAANKVGGAVGSGVREVGRGAERIGRGLGEGIGNLFNRGGKKE